MPASMFSHAYRRVIEAVVQLRRNAGLTQRQLADRLGREQSFIGRIETGQRRVDLVEFVWLCKACNADPQDEVIALLRTMSKTIPAQKRR